MSALCHGCGIQIDEDTKKFCPACDTWENAIPCTRCDKNTPIGCAPCVKYDAWLKENPAKKGTPGLTVHYADDGCWLRFKASNGSEVCLNLSSIADDCGPQTKAMIFQWINETKPKEATDASTSA